LKKGAKVAEWDPYSNTIIAEKDGIVNFNDLIENVSYQEEVDSMTNKLQASMENTFTSNVMFRFKWTIK
jgi:DNA-directed RNA polymerase subunit beta'